VLSSLGNLPAFANMEKTGFQLSLVSVTSESRGSDVIQPKL
jgi:hypothetical protein